MMAAASWQSILYKTSKNTVGTVKKSTDTSVST